MELIVLIIGFFMGLGAVIFWAGYRTGRRQNEILDYIGDHLAYITRELKTIKRKEFMMGQELTDLIAQVNETTTLEGSVIVLLQGIEAQIAAIEAELQAAQVDTAKLVELKDQLHASEEALAAAVANLPPQP